MMKKISIERFEDKVIIDALIKYFNYSNLPLEQWTTEGESIMLDELLKKVKNSRHVSRLTEEAREA